MFERIECPNPAYSQLIETGLAERILKKRRIVKDILPDVLKGTYKYFARDRADCLE